MYDCPPYFPNNEGHMKKFFTTDPNGVHPNEEGHKALAPYFYNALLKELALKSAGGDAGGDAGGGTGTGTGGGSTGPKT